MTADERKSETDPIVGLTQEGDPIYKSEAEYYAGESDTPKTDSVMRLAYEFNGDVFVVSAKCAGMLEIALTAANEQIKRVREETIEECAKVCKERLAARERFLGMGGEYWDGYKSMADEIEAAIRALKC